MHQEMRGLSIETIISDLPELDNFIGMSVLKDPIIPSSMKISTHQNTTSETSQTTQINHTGTVLQKMSGSTVTVKTIYLK